MPVAVKTPDNFCRYLSNKAIFRKYLKENCSIEPYLQLSLKYFVNLCFIPKLFSKICQVQTTFVEHLPGHERLSSIWRMQSEEKSGFQSDRNITESGVGNLMLVLMRREKDKGCSDRMRVVFFAQ